jgi:hypothetical protein
MAAFAQKKTKMKGRGDIGDRLPLAAFPIFLLLGCIGINAKYYLM